MMATPFNLTLRTDLGWWGFYHFTAEEKDVWTGEVACPQTPAENIRRYIKRQIRVIDRMEVLHVTFKPRRSSTTLRARARPLRASPAVLLSSTALSLLVGAGGLCRAMVHEGLAPAGVGLDNLGDRCCSEITLPFPPGVWCVYANNSQLLHFVEVCHKSLLILQYSTSLDRAQN